MKKEIEFFFTVAIFFFFFFNKKSLEVMRNSAHTIKLRLLNFQFRRAGKHSL